MIRVYRIAVVLSVVSLAAAVFLSYSNAQYALQLKEQLIDATTCEYPFEDYSKRVRDLGASVTDLFEATGFSSQSKVYLIDIVDGSIHFRHHPFLVFVHNGCIQSIQAISDETRIYLEDFISKRG